MLKSACLISLPLLSLIITLIHGNPFHHSSSSATFLKPLPQQIRRINPMKFFFTVVHNPEQTPQYSLEWNLPFLKTMLLESAQVSEEDKMIFQMKFFNRQNEYADWSAEDREQLERFTEKYFNLYSSPDTFLPFLDCSALTYAITDEMLKVLHPNNLDEEKRSRARTRAVQRLCNSE